MELFFGIFALKDSIYNFFFVKPILQIERKFTDKKMDLVYFV